MKRVIAVLVLAAAMLLGGCFWGVVPNPGESLVVSAHIVPGTTKVIFEVTGSNSSRFEWDFGDGTTEESENPLIHHTFPEIGRYGVIVVAVGDDNGGGDDMGAPGVGGGIATPGDGKTRSAFVIIDLTRGEELRPVIRTINAFGEPASTFLAWTKVTFDSAGSWAPGTPIEECAFRWRIIRIDPLTGEELGFPWGADGQLLDPRPFVSTLPTFTVKQLPGPSCCLPEVWTYKVTLEMWDAHNNYAIAERRIIVGCR